MTVAAIEHIVIDDNGRARIAGHRIKVSDLVMDRMAHGWTIEQIQEQHPSVTLAQVYAAFAHYYDHKAEIDGEIEQGLKAAESLRAAAGEGPLVARLRAEGKLR